MTTLNLLSVGADREVVVELATTGEFNVCVVGGPNRALKRLADAPFDALLLGPSVQDVEAFLKAARKCSSSLPVVAIGGRSDTWSDVPVDLYDERWEWEDGRGVESLAEIIEKAVTAQPVEVALTDGSRPLVPPGQPSFGSSELFSAVSTVDTVEEGTFIDTILNSLADVLFVTDTNGNLLRWNEQLNVITGYTDEEIARMNPEDFFVEKDAVKSVTEHLESIDSTDGITITVDLLTKDDEQIPYEITASVVESNDEVRYLCGVGRNITERRRAEEQLDEAVAELEQSNTELEQFAYVASHDMKEPLRMVSSYLELLERRYADELDEDAEEFIGFAVEGADRMREMINGLLAYSRVGRRTERFERVDAEDVLETALSNLRIAIEESNAHIESNELPTVTGNSGQLTQLFQNLVANAIKYTSGETPTVKVSGNWNDGEWLFAVSDEGDGIPESRRESIFEIFAGEGGQGGSGIGLAICEKIVEHHGGRIWVDSTVGEGSTFYFTIPESNSETNAV